MVKGILFNTDMVRAIMDGRKTVTRRAIKPRYRDDESGFQVITRKNGEFVRVEKVDENECGIFADGTERYVNPPYQTGDILYIRESYHPNYFDIDTGWGNNHAYKADYEAVRGEIPEPKWTPSIHMPKEAARIWIKVTDVRAERLQDMDGKDVLKEGVNSHVHPDAFYFNGNQLEMFSRLWNSTVKEDWKKYDANPWVWVIEFERCEKPEQCVIDGVEPAEDKRPCLGYGKSEADDEPCEMCKKCNYADGED